MVSWRQRYPVRSSPLMIGSTRAEIEDWIEEQQSFRACWGGRICRRVGQRNSHSKGGRQLTTCRSAASGDALRVYAQARCVSTNEAHRIAGVLQSICGRGAMPTADSILNADARQAKLAEVLTLRVELCCGAVLPSAAMEQQQPSRHIRAKRSTGMKDVQRQFMASYALVHDALVRSIGASR